MDLGSPTDFVRALLAEQAAFVLANWTSVPATRAKNRRDLVTDVDVEVERRIRAALGARFPSHGLQGEELGPERRDAEYQWLIDPIDGTKNYAARSSLFSLSVALFHQGEPLLGVVHDATAGQSFYAWKGGGSHLDGSRLEGSRVNDLESVIANVDTPRSSELGPSERQWFEEKLVLLTRRLYRIRSLGVGSLAACWLATGALDCYVDLTGYSEPEDLGAGRIIMGEAGARVETVDVGIGPPRLLAARTDLWERLRELLL